MLNSEPRVAHHAPRMKAAPLAVVVALLMSSFAGSAASAAPEAVGTLSTLAGGVGWGRATNTAQSPVGVAVLGNRVLAMDGISTGTGVPGIGPRGYPSVIRAIDESTGLASVFAGNGLGGNGSDPEGVPAVRSPLTSSSVVTDAGGNVYVTGENRIRKISPSGIITTIAGTGVFGFSGDGGIATKAQLAGPMGIAIAPDGAVVFSDHRNLRVRRISPEGVISTIAGNGTHGSAGDGGPAVLAQLYLPRLVAFDGRGNLFITTPDDDRIRVVSAAGTITTFARVAVWSLSGIAVDRGDNLLVPHANSIRRYDPLGTATVIAGSEASRGFSGDGGPATEARLADPRGIAVDPLGNIYLADSGNLRVRKIDTKGVITTISGNGSSAYGGEGGQAAAATLGMTLRLSTGPTGTYFEDTGSDQIHHVDPSGVIRTVRESVPQDHHGRDMVVDRTGNLYLIEGNRVVRRAPNGSVTIAAGTSTHTEPRHFSEGGSATEAMLTPTALAIDGDGNLYIADHRSTPKDDGVNLWTFTFIRRVSTTGVITTVAGVDGTRRTASYPSLAQDAVISGGVSDMVVGADGALFALQGTSVLRIRCGVVSRQSSLGSQGLVVDRAGNLFSLGEGMVWRTGPDGTVVPVAGGGTVPVEEGPLPATKAQLYISYGDVGLDDVGNLYVTYLDRVLKISGVSAGAAVPGRPCDAAPDRPVWGWGWNGLGALGDASSPGRVRPDTDNPPITGVTALSGGMYHSLALKGDGTVWAWGYNGYGQLGDGSTETRSTPTRVAGLTDVVSIAAGWLHNVAVTRDGSVWAWGWNGVGQLGDGSTATSLTPRRVAGLTGASSVSASLYGSLAVKADGNVWSWGWNGYGQLGDGTTVDRRSPVRVAGLSGVTSAQMGLHHTLARKSDGTVWSWGWNYFGQVGDGTKLDRHVPVRLALDGVTAVSAGGYHSHALLADGTLRGWGWNGMGAFGAGPGPDSATPMAILFHRDVKAVANGLAHTVIIRHDGTMSSWGWNHVGQLGLGAADEQRTGNMYALPHATAVAAGAAHTLAVFDLS